MVKRREGPISSGARVVTLSVSRSSSTYVGFRIKVGVLVEYRKGLLSFSPEKLVKPDR